MLPKDSIAWRRKFWRMVYDCLVYIHKLPRQEARRIIDRYITEFPLWREDHAGNEIYYFTSLQASEILTRNKLDYEKVQDLHHFILDKHYPEYPLKEWLANLIFVVLFLVLFSLVK